MGKVNLAFLERTSVNERYKDIHTQLKQLIGDKEYSFKQFLNEAKGNNKVIADFLWEILFNNSSEEEISEVINLFKEERPLATQIVRILISCEKARQREMIELFKESKPLFWELERLLQFCKIAWQYISEDEIIKICLKSKASVKEISQFILYSKKAQSQKIYDFFVKKIVEEKNQEFFYCGISSFDDFLKEKGLSFSEFEK